MTREEQAANRRLWVEALRSGKYAQARNSLRYDWHDGDGGGRESNYNYCCLGVLCELYDPSLWYESHGVGPLCTSSYMGPVWGHDKHQGVPSKSVLAWAGISFEVAQVLAKANDAGKTFIEIADVVETMSLEA
jgi:hypothetical protein